jgi:protein gp37
VVSDSLASRVTLLSQGNGTGARPMDLGWARGIVAQCRAGGIPVFVKQLGVVAGRELGAGPKGGDWDAWPADLRVCEFPGRVAASRLGVTGAGP